VPIVRPLSTPAPPAAPDAAAAAPAAVAEPKVHADWDYVVVSYLLVVVAIFGGWGLWHAAHKPVPTVVAGVSVFAPLYILAQSIERLLEPFATMLGGADGADVRAGPGLKKTDAMQIRADALLARDFDLAAQAQKIVDQIRHNTAVTTWALATTIAMLACGAFGIRLMHTIGLEGVTPFWDILITGLAVGSGTKPLHDLISNIQKSKEQSEDPPETSSGG